MLLSPCPLCNRSNPPTAKFCEACGVGLVALCPACSSVNEVGAAACFECSAPLPASDARRIGNALQAVDPRAEPTPSRAFLVRFDADGSVAVRPMPTLDGAPATDPHALAPLIAQHLPARHAPRWQAGVATAALAAVGVAGLMAFMPRGEKVPVAIAPAPTAAPIGTDIVTTTRAPLALPPPSAGPIEAAPTVQAAAATPKAPAAAPHRVAIRPPRAALPAAASGSAASRESAAAVAAALTRQRVADGRPPRPPAPRGGATCSDTVAALGLCPSDSNRKP